MSISSRATVRPWRSTTPPERTCSAVLTTMSMRAPFCSACSVTDSVSVTSSGTISTRSIFFSASRPGNGFHGSARPTNTMRGAGIGERLRHRLTDRGAAVGDQHAAEFRIAGHLAQMRIVGHVRGVLFRQRQRHRRAALVELELQPHAGAFGGVAVQMRDHHRPDIELHGADPPRRALAEIRIGRGLHRGLGDQRAAVGRHRGTAAAPTGTTDRRRAADRSRRCSRGRPAGRSGLRPRPRSGRARCGCGRPAATAAAACAAADSCAWVGRAVRSRGPRENGGAGRQAAIVVDHAEAGNQAVLGIGHRRADRLRR